MRGPNLVFKCALISLVLYSVSSLYTNEDDVVILTEDTFEHKVLNCEAIWIIEFYAPWCGHCKNLAPEYIKAAKALKGAVVLGAVDATVEQNLAKKFGVNRYPTIKVFGEDKETPVDYNRARTSKAIIEFSLEEVKKRVEIQSGIQLNTEEKEETKETAEKKETDVIELTDANFDELVLKSTKPFLVEFFAPWCGHCKKLAPEWEQAATNLKGKINVGALDATVNQEKAKEYEVKGYPTIKFFNNGNVEDYKMGRGAREITNFALSKLSPQETEEKDDEVQSDVVKLTNENFDELVLKSGEPFLVEFFAPWCGHCKKLAPEWEIAATQLKGKVKVGALDATVNKEKATEYEVKGYPTIKFFKDGNIEEYRKGRRAGDIIEFALSKISTEESEEVKVEL